MKKFLSLSLLLLLLPTMAVWAEKPWDNGPLQVSANGRFLQHSNGKPFFWLADTGWLLPQRLNRDEAAHYLQQTAEAEFNVVQIQVLNELPSYNVYGQSSDDEAYWRHLDYIVGAAERNGIYVAMVCVWGSQVKRGRMDEAKAKEYGAFLARRYADRPNIIWMIGGDLRGDIHPEVWQALATSIKAVDKTHLMTYHPRGRFTSACWWSDAAWIDFHTFQSGHRRYGQQMGSKDYIIPEGTEEDNWQYVALTWQKDSRRPVLDAEPSYEDIPQGLHGVGEPRWTSADVRRYAYWSVFAGSCGHTYGHNSIMQFYRYGLPPAYQACEPWYDALQAEGRHQMRYLKELMLMLPYFERVPDQDIVRDNGTGYDRLCATRGNDYLLVYNYTGRTMTLDFNRIVGEEKTVWWMEASTGRRTLLGTFKSGVVTLRPHHAGDGVLIAIDSSKHYIE